MANNVEITFTADNRQADRAYDKLQAQNEKLARQLEKLKDRSRQTTQVGRRGMEQQASATTQTVMAVSGLVAQYISLGSAITLAVKEHQKLNQIQEQARQKIVAPAGALRAAKFAFEPDAGLTETNFEQQLKSIAQRTGSDLTTVAQVFEFASSAKGSLSNKELLSAVETALRIQPGAETAQEAAFAASRMLGISKISGSRDMRVAAGFQMNLGLASHGANMEAIGQHLVPAINQMAAFGDTQEQAGEIGSALSQMLQDDQLRITSNALQKLGSNLRDFNIIADKSGKLMAKDVLGKAFEVPAEQMERFRAASNTLERMQVMRESPELFAAFEATASFETKSKQAVLSLVRGDETAMRELGFAQEVVRGTQSAADQAFQAKLLEDKISFFNEGDPAILAATERRGKAARESIAQRNTRGARLAAARKEFNAALAEMNLRGSTPDVIQEQMLAMRLAKAEQELAPGEAPELASIRVLRELRQEQSSIGLMQSARGGLQPRETPQIDSAIQNIEIQMQQMQEQTRSLKEQTNELKSMNRKLDRTQRPQQTDRPAAQLSRNQ